jgi:hypothetical protein
MYTLALDTLPLVLFVLAYLGRKEVRSFVKDFTTIGEDLWTWTTLTGDLYEDVEVRNIEEGEVMIQHKLGTSRVAIDDLSDKSRELLARTRKWQDYVLGEPADGKITSFISSSHAHAA